jgi:hypothetical protein
MSPDSTFVHQFITETLPGISPAFVAIVAGYLGTRFIWLLKIFLAVLAGSNIPVLNTAMTKIKYLWGGDPSKLGDRGLGWLINPALMMLAGMITTGKWDQATLMTFVGIGVREWLIKSPIPTSAAELKKLKATFIIPIAIVLGLLIAIPAQAAVSDTTSVKKISFSIPQRLLFSTGVGYQRNYVAWKLEKDINPFVGVKIGFLLNGKFAIQTESTWINKDSGHFKAGIWFSP